MSNIVFESLKDILSFPKNKKYVVQNREENKLSWNDDVKSIKRNFSSKQGRHLLKFKTQFDTFLKLQEWHYRIEYSMAHIGSI